MRYDILPYAPTINSCSHLIISVINRGAVTALITPYWRRRRLCGDLKVPKKTSTVERLQIQQAKVLSYIFSTQPNGAGISGGKSDSSDKSESSDGSEAAAGGE